MDRIYKPGKPLVGFGVNQLGTCDLEIGPRYHSIMIEAIATAAAGQTLTLADFLGLITVKVNGKPQRIHLATELDAIQTSYGTHFNAQIWNYDTGVINYVNGLPQAAQAGKQTICYLTIWFAEPWRKTWGGAESFAWYTAWQNGAILSSFQLEVTGGPSTHLLAASAITANLYVEQDSALGALDANKNPVLFINKWNRLAVQYTGAGDLPIGTLLKKDPYMEFRFFCQAGDDISKAILSVNSKTIRQVTKGQNDATLIARDFNPAGMSVDRFDLIMDANDIPTSALQTMINGVAVSDFTITITLNNAAAANKIINLLSQRYGPPD